MAARFFNFFWGTLALLVGMAMTYAFYTPLMSFANEQPTTEMKLIAYAGAIILITFLDFIVPISFYIADDEGNV